MPRSRLIKVGRIGTLPRLIRVVVAAAVLFSSACAPPTPVCNSPPRPSSSDTVYVISRGWHVDIGLMADQLRGPLTVYRDVFPGARAFIFGYGKRTFMTAPPQTFSEYFLGPLPGPAAIQVTGLNVVPTDAYDVGETIVLSLPPGGGAALSDFIWNDLAKDKDGSPRLIGPGHNFGSLFYGARSQYNLLHTCNTWAIEALAAAGLPISSSAVVFSGQATSRIETMLAARCETPPPEKNR